MRADGEARRLRNTLKAIHTDSTARCRDTATAFFSFATLRLGVSLLAVFS
jgi:hypothetical protein